MKKELIIPFSDGPMYKMEGVLVTEE